MRIIKRNGRNHKKAGLFFLSFFQDFSSVDRSLARSAGLSSNIIIIRRKILIIIFDHFACSIDISYGRQSICKRLASTRLDSVRVDLVSSCVKIYLELAQPCTRSVSRWVAGWVSGARSDRSISISGLLLLVGDP